MNIFVAFHNDSINTTEENYINKFDKILRISNVKSDVGKEVAWFLHRTLQTRIAASAMRFRNSDEVQFDFKFECQQVLKHFELEKKLINFTKNEKLASQMSNLVDFWSPLLVCQIEIDVNETKINKIPVNRIIDLVNESLSNALRHEKAKSVRIQLLDFINDVLVVVTNDGELIRSIRKGLDSKLFDEPTNERWEITNMSENTGVRFSGLVPIN